VLDQPRNTRDQGAQLRLVRRIRRNVPDALRVALNPGVRGGRPHRLQTPVDLMHLAQPGRKCANARAARRNAVGVAHACDVALVDAMLGSDLLQWLVGVLVVVENVLDELGRIVRHGYSCGRRESGRERAAAHRATRRSARSRISNGR
jgi:hypothetical protein